VIPSLRTQISDLFSQVNLLNSKLVQSHDRVSNLEETLDDNTERLRALEGERMNLEREKSVLELERAKQEQMVKDGRLVERSAVAAELNRYVQFRTHLGSSVLMFYLTPAI
jgi:septal ring factor EnvC (AmiA/AmiB activator)